MERQKVKSSNIESIGYDREKLLLEVEFKGGSLYQYKDVGPAVYLELMDSDSKGQHFSAKIRKFFKGGKVK